MRNKTIIGNINKNELWVPLGYQLVTSAAAPTALVPPTGAIFCIMQAEVTTARWSDTTTLSPTTTAGMLLSERQLPYIYTGKKLSDVNIWVTNGNVSVMYYR